jgi:hypothetical protein
MCKIFTVAFAEFNIETAEAVKGERVPKDFEKEVAEILSATRARPCGKECFTARNLALYTLGMLPRFGEFRTALIRHAYAGKCMRCRHADGIRYKNVGPFCSFSLVFIRRKPYFLMYMIKKNENLPSMWIIQN